MMLPEIHISGFQGFIEVFFSFTACSSLAIGPPGQTGGSLLHNLVRQSQREKSRMESSKVEERAIADKLFAVLGNSVWSSECRNVLWKVGLYSAEATRN